MEGKVDFVVLLVAVRHSSCLVEAWVGVPGTQCLREISSILTDTELYDRVNQMTIYNHEFYGALYSGFGSV